MDGKTNWLTDWPTIRVTNRVSYMWLKVGMRVCARACVCARTLICVCVCVCVSVCTVSQWQLFLDASTCPSVCPSVHPPILWTYDLRDEADVPVGRGWKVYCVRKQTSVRKRASGSKEEEEEEEGELGRMRQRACSPTKVNEVISESICSMIGSMDSEWM